MPLCRQYRDTTSFPKTFATRGAGVVRLDLLFKAEPRAKVGQSLFFRHFGSDMLRFTAGSTLRCLEASPIGVEDIAADPQPWYTADDPR